MSEKVLKVMHSEVYFGKCRRDRHCFTTSAHKPTDLRCTTQSRACQGLNLGILSVYLFKVRLLGGNVGTAGFRFDEDRTARSYRVVVTPYSSDMIITLACQVGSVARSFFRAPIATTDP